MSPFEETKERERTRQQVIRSEHSQMPKTCDQCGGKMEFTSQSLTSDPALGDILVYECTECGNVIERFFKFPGEYARFFKD
ncbi:MAG: hypothetical protein JSV58_00485 [Candidatus Bathyarchaeota archaeon]|nr:MAG: hypothetical protein JSV58_00485 [Candidatus Bathyarchaeota archaeon]